jgi:hypothetical protein
MSDPADLTSLINLQMPLVLGTLMPEKVLHNWLQHYHILREPHSTHNQYLDKEKKKRVK